MFDASEDLTLAELLSPAQVEQALALLSKLCGVKLTLLSVPEDQATAIEFNLEPVAWLKADLSPPQREAAASMLELLVFHAGKYRLAANLHRSASQASYQELQEQNAALQVSEARYRHLSETLQEQVDSQVEMIRESQQRLYENARLRAVGQLAAGMAHEINTPIGFITSNLHTAKEYLNDLTSEADEASHQELIEDFHCLLAESLDGAGRISRIIRDIRHFANIDQSDFHDFDLNALVKTATKLLQSELQTNATVSLQLDSLPRIPGYPARVGQAIYNAMSNALHSVEDEGQVTVSTRLDEDMVEIVFTDNGHGMDEETLARAFEPFFTTRAVGKGTGLGLSVVRDAVKAHHGDVVLTSRVGNGTTLTLRLPTRWPSP